MCDLWTNQVNKLWGPIHKVFMWMVLCPRVDRWGHMDLGRGKPTQG